jgi:competence protein ComGC
MDRLRPVRVSQSPTAFSLIEMLLVITVVMVLLALIMPTITAARSRARQFSCSANLRSQNQGILAYTLDDKSRALPYCTVYSGGWQIRISRYLGWTGSTVMDSSERDNVGGTLIGNAVDRKIPAMACPESKLLTRSQYYYQTYQYNAGLAAGTPERQVTNGPFIEQKPTHRRRYTTARSSHSILMMVADSTNLTDGPNAYYDGITGGLANGRYHPNGAAKLTNVMTLDGHVEAVTYPAFNGMTFLDQ